MNVPAGMTDLFPAISLGSVALIGLMIRIDPPPMIRLSVVSVLGLLLILYLTGRLHVWLPDSVGLPLYLGLVALAAAIIVWSWRDRRKGGAK